jgi:hypothetical protein
MSTRRTIVLAGSTIVLATITLAVHRWIHAEPTVVVMGDPAGQRATLLLNAADTAMAHGKPEVAREALASAFVQPTASPEVAYRVARLADRLDDAGTAARAYRRYLAVAPASPVTDTVRTRLLALVRGPSRETTVVAATMVAAGETDRVVEVAPAPRRRGAGAVRRATLRAADAR